MNHSSKSQENFNSENLEKNKQKNETNDNQRKSNRPPQYQKVNENIRQQIIDQACNKGLPLRQIASNLGIKYSTAKAIVQVYQNEGRIGKKQTRDKRIFQQIETYMIIVHKQSGKIEKLKHKSECNDLKTNFVNSKLNLEEAHYSQIAQYFGRYNLDLGTESQKCQNQNIISLIRILNDQYQQFQQQS